MQKGLPLLGDQNCENMNMGAKYDVAYGTKDNTVKNSNVKQC